MVTTIVHEEQCTDVKMPCSWFQLFTFVNLFCLILNLTSLFSSLRTIVYAKFPSEVIATAAIYMAARVLQIPLPENPAWWELFDANKARTFANG